MNILLTNECNRRCPYCFAAERVSFTTEGKQQPNGVPKFISVDDFKVAIDFARRSKQDKVGLLGGEPSLHPKLIELLKIAWDAGLHTKVFSNGLWSDKKIDAVLDAVNGNGDQFGVIVNTNHPEITPPAQRKHQRRLYDKLGRYATLSFNLFDPKYDTGFLVDYILEHKMRRHIRLGIAQPLADQESAFVAPDEYSTLAPMLVDLARRCDAHDITIGFDCGFVMCMFTTEQVGTLIQSGCRFRLTCGPAIDVGTDLSVWACFPLSTLSRGVLLTDFEDLDALAKHFQKDFGRLYRSGTLPECIDCKYLRRKQCAGGCAAHVYRSYNP